MAGAGRDGDGSVIASTQEYDRVVGSERRVQRPPGGLLDGPPWRRPPVQHLADPRLHHVTAMKESRTPPVAVLGQPQLISVALHSDDARAKNERSESVQGS